LPKILAIYHLKKHNKSDQLIVFSSQNILVTTVTFRFKKNNLTNLNFLNRNLFIYHQYTLHMMSNAPKTFPSN